MFGGAQLPGPSPFVHGSVGFVDAHTGTRPNVKMKSLTPFCCAIAIELSILGQLDCPWYDWIIAQ